MKRESAGMASATNRPCRSRFASILYRARRRRSISRRLTPARAKLSTSPGAISEVHSESARPSYAPSARAVRSAPAGVRRGRADGVRSSSMRRTPPVARRKSARSSSVMYLRFDIASGASNERGKRGIVSRCDVPFTGSRSDCQLPGSIATRRSRPAEGGSARLRPGRPGRRRLHRNSRARAAAKPATGRVGAGGADQEVAVAAAPPVLRRARRA